MVGLCGFSFHSTSAAATTDLAGFRAADHPHQSVPEYFHTAERHQARQDHFYLVRCLRFFDRLLVRHAAGGIYCRRGRFRFIAPKRASSFQQSVFSGHDFERGRGCRSSFEYDAALRISCNRHGRLLLVLCGDGSPVAGDGGPCVGKCRTALWSVFAARQSKFLPRLER